jgi:hypothetical protein
MKTQLTGTIGVNKYSISVKFIVISAYINKSQQSQINNLIVYFMLLETRKPKISSGQK